MTNRTEHCPDCQNPGEMYVEGMWGCPNCSHTWREGTGIVTMESDIESESTSWDWLTVMDGPKVSGKSRIWFGRHEEPWTQLGSDFQVVRCAEPVEYVPLPRSMTREEIENWLADGWGEKLIECNVK